METTMAVKDGEKGITPDEKLETTAAVSTVSAFDQLCPDGHEEAEAWNSSSESLEISFDINAVMHEMHVETVCNGEDSSSFVSNHHVIASKSAFGNQAPWWNCCGLLDVIKGSKDNYN